MQHSAHDETCNIAEIVKCRRRRRRRRRAVDVATVYRQSPHSFCLPHYIVVLMQEEVSVIAQMKQ